MKNDAIERLRSLMEKATPGEWQVSGVRGKIVSGKRTYNYHGIGPDGVECAAVWFDERTGAGFLDAHAIVETHNALPSLLSHIDALEARVEEERSYIDNAVSKAPEPLRQLGEYLAGLLDEDQWPHAERYLNAAAIAAEEAVEVLRPFADGDLDISHTAIIPNYGVDVPGILERARAFLTKMGEK